MNNLVPSYVHVWTPSLFSSYSGVLALGFLLVPSPFCCTVTSLTNVFSVSSSLDCGLSLNFLQLPFLNPNTWLSLLFYSCNYCDAATLTLASSHGARLSHKKQVLVRRLTTGIWQCIYLSCLLVKYVRYTRTSSRTVGSASSEHMPD